MARRAHDFLPKPARQRRAVRWHIGASDKVTICGIACKCVKQNADGYIFQSLTDPDCNFTFTRDEYDALLDRQDFDLEPDGLNLAKAEAKLAAGVSSARELGYAVEVVTELRQVALWKFFELEKAGEASRTRSFMDEVIEKHIQPHVDEEARKHAKDGVTTSIKVPKSREFERWIKRFEKSGQLGIIPKRHRCGRRNARYGGDVLNLVRKHALRFMRGERPTRKLIYDDLKADIDDVNRKRRLENQPDLPLPNDDFLSKVIDRLPPFDVDAGRNLELDALRRFHPSRGGVPNLTRPLERVEVDDWEVHLYVLTVEAGFWEFMSSKMKAATQGIRCTLSVAICCLTRVLPAVVLSLGPHSVNTATLLRLCMTDKTPMAQSIGCETPYEYCGNIFQFVSDEGSPILNARTQGICDAFSIEYLSPQIKTPQQRAKVERVFQTLEIRSLLRFSGRAFNNPTVRGKYEAQLRACVTVDELAAILLRFIVDQYHNTPHDGLDGETPRYRYIDVSKRIGPRSLPGKALLRRGFGEPYTAVLHPGGIEIFGNWYRSTKLEKLFREIPQRNYLVIVDAEDLGGISVRLEPDAAACLGQETAGWLEVAGPSCMNGVSASVWDMSLASLRRQTKHVEAITEQVRLNAIRFAQDMDAQSRKRLAIQYRLKTPEEIEALRNSIGTAVRFDADTNPRPDGPVDMFAGAKPAGTKAPVLTDGSAVTPSPEPVSVELSKRPPAKPRHAKFAPAKSPADISAPKAARPWKPKERK